MEWNAYTRILTIPPGYSDRCLRTKKKNAFENMRQKKWMGYLKRNLFLFDRFQIQGFFVFFFAVVPCLFSFLFLLFFFLVLVSFVGWFADAVAAVLFCCSFLLLLLFLSYSAFSFVCCYCCLWILSFLFWSLVYLFCLFACFFAGVVLISSIFFVWIDELTWHEFVQIK